MRKKILAKCFNFYGFFKVLEKSAVLVKGLQFHNFLLRAQSLLGLTVLTLMYFLDVCSNTGARRASVDRKRKISDLSDSCRGWSESL